METDPDEQRISIRDLQRNAADVFDRAKQGESFTVTRRGMAVGRVLPPDEREADLMDVVERGLIDLDDLDGLPGASEAKDMEREPSDPGTRPATDALAELRAEEDR
ncbi:type II toxin-antitoxin system prevent-host-death family antitoxin [Nocardiopsis sp. HNM0947]|uniref:Type II toxin-antitoxin system prevent-host-death family antitoxin n=1 Tax=Nocardiopsis coralli TaxID=2772213 RepID=A0ABR9PAS1_9ACTN|nr:type II toxin-antitoxin system prevent-host-death family antitoxin [Nocardiopsis coralli]MBE3000942.1 type II toxin-antitoxin system prevent-host-death family antitoxin [Nocardiopsis coralli]